MDAIYKLGAVVRLVDMFTGPAGRAGASAKGLARNIHLVDKALKAVKIGMVALGVAAALTVPLAGGAEAAGTFETSLTRLGLISQATAGEMAQLRAEALKLGVATEWSPKEAVAGMTALASAGYRVEDQLRGIPAVLDFATAGIGDLTVSVKLIDSALKSYGLGMDKAGEVTDKMTRLTQIASVEMGELATSIPVVTAAGAAANQSLSQTLALMGTIRPAAQSTQDAAQIFNSFAEAIKSPTLRMQKMMRTNFGVDVNKLFRAEGGTGALLPMVDIIENLGQATAGMTDQQQQLFLKMALNQTGAKAYNAVLHHTFKVMRDGQLVTLRGVEAVRAMTETLDDSTGTTKKFAQEMMETWNGVKKMIAGTLETFAIVLGMGPLKVLKALISAITGLLNPVLAWMQRHERLTTIVGASVTLVVGLAAAVGFLALMMGLAGLLTAKIGLALSGLSLTALKGKFLALAGGVRSFSAALLFSPIGKVALVLMALVGVVIWAYNRFQGFRDLVDDLGARARSLAQGIWAGLVVTFKALAERLEPLINLFVRVTNWIGLTGTTGDETSKIYGKWIDIGIRLGKVLGGVIVAALTAIIVKMTILTAVMLANPITWAILLIAAVIGLVLALVNDWGGITTWLTKQWEVVGAFFGRLWERIKGAFWRGVEWIKWLFWDYQPAVLIYTHWDAIVGYFSGLWGRAVGAVRIGLAWLKRVFWDYHPAVLIYTHWDAIVGYFTGLWDRVLTAVTQGWQRIKDHFAGLNLADSGRALWETFVSGLQSIIDKPLEVIKGGLARLRNLLPFSDAKEGPLSRLTASGAAIPQTLAKGLEAGMPKLRAGWTKALDGLGLDPEAAAGGPLSGGNFGGGGPARVDLAALQEQFGGFGGQGGQSPAAAPGQAGPGRPITINNLTLNVDADDLSSVQDLVDLIRGLGVEEARA